MSSPLSQPVAWDRVSEGYAETTEAQLMSLNRQALAQIDFKKNWKVLDVACGTGAAAVELARRLEHVDAIDFSEKMLLHLRKKQVEGNIRNIRIWQGDAQRLPMKDQYDLITSFFGLMFFPDRKAALCEMVSRLQPQGWILISSWPPLEESSAMTALNQALLAAMPPSQGSVIPRPGLLTQEDYLREIEGTGLELTRFEKFKVEIPAPSAKEFFLNSLKGMAALQDLRSKMQPLEWQRVGRAMIESLEQSEQYPTTFEYVANFGFLRRSV